MYKRELQTEDQNKVPAPSAEELLEITQQVDYIIKVREFGLGRYYLNIPHRYLDLIGWKKGEALKMVLIFRQGAKGKVLFIPAEEGREVPG